MTNTVFIFLIPLGIFLVILFVKAIEILNNFDRETRLGAQAFSQIKDAVVITDKNEKIVYWNKGAERLYGYKAHQIIGEIFDEVIGPVRDQAQLKKDGKKLQVESSISSIRGKDNSLYTLAIIRDVTEKKRREEYQNFLAEADIKMLSSLDHNEILKKITSLSVPYIADWCLVDLINGESLNLISAVHKNIKKVSLIHQFRENFLIKSGHPLSIRRILQENKAQMISVDERHPLTKLKSDQYVNLLKNLNIKAVMIVPLIIRGKAMGAITFVSTTSGRVFDKKSLELAENLASRAAIAVDNAQLYLRAQEAIKTREEFLSLASHELKTPLTSLLLQLQMVIRSISQDSLAKLSIERLLKLLTNAEQQSKKLANLISNLLNVSRITGGRLDLRLTEANLSDIVNKVIQNFNEQLESEGKIRFKTDASIIGRWDELQLEQVVTNLVSNAVKYGQGNPIEIKLEKENSTARLIVKDSGIGIESGEIPNIFKPFARVTENSEHQGLGVGLYIVQQIVEAHKGKIDVDSHVGKGTTFSVELPINKNYLPN